MKTKWYKSKGGWIGASIFVLLVVGAFYFGTPCGEFCSAPFGIKILGPLVSGLILGLAMILNNVLKSFPSMTDNLLKGIFWITLIIIGFSIGWLIEYILRKNKWFGLR